MSLSDFKAIGNIRSSDQYNHMDSSLEGDYFIDDPDQVVFLTMIDGDENGQVDEKELNTFLENEGFTEAQIEMLIDYALEDGETFKDSSEMTDAFGVGELGDINPDNIELLMKIAPFEGILELQMEKAIDSTSEATKENIETTLKGEV